MEFETSAGGIVIDGNKVLIIKTRSLKGDVVHTFPKGNIGEGEKPQETALREVLEETGYECQLIKELEKIQYFYRRGKNLIKKNVYWYLMKPIKKIKEHDYEVLDVLWCDINDVKELLSYKSDLELLEKIIRNNLSGTIGKN